jgi:hypothetical protein
VLAREADMDDIAVVPARRIGEIVGVSTTHALSAVRALDEVGRIAIIGNLGSGGGLEIRVGEPA